MKKAKDIVTKNNYDAFLTFIDKDLSLFKNLAKDCCNFNILKEIHLPPYYYCISCKKEYCYNCIMNHLTKNVNDKKHSINNIVTKDLIQLKVEKVLNNINENNNNITSIYDIYIKEIEEELKHIIKIKISFIKIIEKIEHHLKNYLNSLKKKEIENSSRKEKITKLIINNINILVKIDNLIKKEIILINKDFTKIKEDIYINKKKYFNEFNIIIKDLNKKNILESNIYESKSNSMILDEKDNKIINLKRKRSPEKENNKLENKIHINNKKISGNLSSAHNKMNNISQNDCLENNKLIDNGSLINGISNINNKRDIFPYLYLSNELFDKCYKDFFLIGK